MVEGGYRSHEAALKRAKLEANELLWDNLEESIWWEKFENFTDREVEFEKIRLQHELYNPALVSFKNAFIPSILSVRSEPAKLVLQYGASRRLHSIHSSINTIAEISYPKRMVVCTEDEQTRLADALLVFYVSIPAFFDALAMASFRVFAPKKYNEKEADLFSRKYWHALGLADSYCQIESYIAWFKRVKTDMRDHYAHRIPPYVPSAEHSSEDAVRYKELQADYSKAIFEHRFGDLSNLSNDMDQIGSFSSLIWFFEKSACMPLNPTVFNDLLTFQTVALEMWELLSPHSGFLGTEG